MLFMDGHKLMVHRTLYEQAWWPALDKAEVKRRYRYHSLRHFTASNLLSEGASLPAVAGYIGDNQQTVLRVYSHWLEDDADVPATILDRLLAAGNERDVSQTCHDDHANNG